MTDGADIDDIDDAGGADRVEVVRRRTRRWLPADPTTVGEDPDYRFTLANERTFLAWIRTALALGAGGLAAITLIEDTRGADLLGIVLLVLGFATAATAYRRWALNELAMRLDEPLPTSRLPLVMALCVAAVALVAGVAFALDAT